MVIEIIMLFRSSDNKVDNNENTFDNNDCMKIMVGMLVMVMVIMIAIGL